MAGSVVFVWEVQSICRSQTWNPNVTETLYWTAEQELFREYHKFNFIESYGAEMMKVAPRW